MTCEHIMNELWYEDNDTYAADNDQASIADVGEMVKVLELRLGLLENGETNEYVSHFDEHSSEEESSGE
jgi:hypothetical protein